MMDFEFLTVGTVLFSALFLLRLFLSSIFLRAQFNLLLVFRFLPQLFI